MANGKPGAPLKHIGKLEFEKLCALQCTQQEIADFFEVDHRTLTRWCKRTYKKDYSQVYLEKRTGGRIALRRLQMRLAEKSATMAIFLGKNYLGQSDNPAPDVSDEFIKKSNEQIKALADLINNPVEDVDIETLADEAENEQHENEGAEQ